MQARELRIGNYVMYEPTIDDWEETIITLHKLLQVDILPDNYCGIPLTDEWLLKFGFFKNSLNFFKKDGILISDEYEVFLGQVIVELKYVHELQNLYFALTGEELELKL